MAAIYAPASVIWARVLRNTIRTPGGCWMWQGATTSRGYGCICSGKHGRNITTHRLAVMFRDGHLDDDMTVDHQCHDSHTCRLDVDCPHRRCVNPAHLKVMTVEDNIARQWAETSVCRKGHPLSLRANGRRRCKTCAADYAAARRDAASQPRAA